MSIDDSYNFREINEQITSSGVVNEERLKSLGNEGCQVVINLLPDSHEHAVAEEKKIIETQNIQYVYIPVDFSCPKYEEFIEFSNVLDSFDEKKVHIHCAVNWRVSAFYGAYAIKKGIWSKEKADDFIADIWNPAEYPVWNTFLTVFGLGSFGDVR